MSKAKIDKAMQRAALQVQPTRAGHLFVNGKGATVSPGSNANKQINELRIINALCNLYGDRAVQSRWDHLKGIIESGASLGRALPAAIRVMGGGVIC